MLAELFNATTGWVELLLLVTMLIAAATIIFMQGGHRVITRPRRRGGIAADRYANDSEDFDRLLRL
jgi:cell division protein FtsL